MKNFKSLLLFTLGVCGSVISYIIILFFVRRSKNIKVFDIDNTLALSDPYIYQFDYNIYDVPVNIRLKCILVSEEKKKARIVYLSHRPIHQIFGTFFWIKKNVSKKVKLTDIILVPKIEYKLSFLKLLICKSKSILEYYDDLHYGFEVTNGPFPYDNIIARVNEINLKHYDYSFIINHER